MQGTDGVTRFTPGVLGRGLGVVLSLAFIVAGSVIMFVARGPVMPGPLFVALPVVFLVAVARSVGLELTLDDVAISQVSVFGGSWVLPWSDVESWQVLRSQSQYAVILVGRGSVRHRVSSWLANRSEMRSLLQLLEHRLGPPAKP